MEFDWKICPEDRDRIEQIADRYMALCTVSTRLKDKVRKSTVMDLICCHNHACPLDFEKLLQADNFNLLHDVQGIRNCLNRTNGQLENCFLPRCAVPQG